MLWAYCTIRFVFNFFWHLIFRHHISIFYFNSFGLGLLMMVQYTRNAQTDILFSKIEVPRDERNSKSENMTCSGENNLNIRTNASPKWDRTRCPEE